MHAVTRMVEPRPHAVVLASGSASRRQMLAAAGVAFEVLPSTVDELAVKRRLEQSSLLPPASLELATETARVLAHEKALEVSRRRPEALIIGADQTLVLPSDGTSDKIQGSEHSPQRVEVCP